MGTDAEQPGREGQTADVDTALVTLTLTEVQFRVVAAIVNEKLWFIRSTDGLLAKEVLYRQTNGQNEALEALVQNTVEAASELVEKITIESFLVIFTTTNPPTADLETFKARLRRNFPDALKYHRHTEEDPRLGKDLAFHVYVPVTVGEPDLETVGQVMQSLQGVEYRQTLQSWQGDREKCLARKPWTALT